MKEVIKRAKQLVPIPQKVLNTIGLIKVCNEQLKKVKGERLSKKVEETNQRLKKNIEVLANNLILSGDFEAAIKQLELLENIANEDEKELKAFCHKNIGIAYRKMLKLKKAEDELEIALELYREIANRGGEADVIGEMGLVNVSRGEFVQAMEKQEEAKRIHKKTANLQGVGIASANIALIHFLKGDTTNALSYYHDALELLKENAHPVIVANVLASLSEVYCEAGNLFKALHYLNLAIEIREIMQDEMGKLFDAQKIQKLAKNHLVVYHLNE